MGIGKNHKGYKLCKVCREYKPKGDLVIWGRGGVQCKKHLRKMKG